MAQSESLARLEGHGDDTEARKRRPETRDLEGTGDLTGDGIGAMGGQEGSYGAITPTVEGSPTKPRASQEQIKAPGSRWSGSAGGESPLASLPLPLQTPIFIRGRG